MTQPDQQQAVRKPMSFTGKAIAICSVSALVLAGSLSFAQAPNPPGQPEVSSPEPAPNPVQEMRDPPSGPPTDTGADTGLDTGLETIEEPVQRSETAPAPALRQEGEGEWRRPEQAPNASESSAGSGAAQLTPEELAARARANRDNEMPRMVGPSIPIVPLDLLFPPELAAAIEATIVRETRGSLATVAVMDRDRAVVERVRIPVGGNSSVGTLSIKVTACFKSAPEDPIESWAYMEVVDQGRQAPPRLAVLPQRDRAKLRQARGPRLLRRGWMIASSPAVTPVDHPVYDVWVEDCEGSAGGPTPVATLEELERPRPNQAAPTTDQESKQGN